MVQAQLSSLTRDFTATSAAAQRTLKGLFGRRAAKAVVDVDAVPTAQLRPGYGASTGRTLFPLVAHCMLFSLCPPVFDLHVSTSVAHCVLPLGIWHQCKHNPDAISLFAFPELLWLCNSLGSAIIDVLPMYMSVHCIWQPPPLFIYKFAPPPQ